jgi:basic membrane protein A
VKISRWLLMGAIAALVAVGVATGTGSAAHNATVKVALVTDIGGLNDKGFNHLAYLGITKAEKTLGITGRVYNTQLSSQRLPNLQAAAAAGYKLVIGTGFNFFQDYAQVSPVYPHTKFAGIDVDNATAGHLPNYHGLVFHEEQAGYLVGYIAGLMIKAHPYKGKQIVSAVGANPVPAIVHYLAGYKAGAKKADPGVTVLLDMANDPTFNNQALCKATTHTQVTKGSGIVFEAAGGCGLGGLTEAKQDGIWGIGVDANQGYLGSFMLTSALKKVDVAVFNIIKQFKANPASVKGNTDTVFDVKSGGVGYAPLSTKVPAGLRATITTKVNAIAKLIANGTIKVPTTY